jgi:hypothetical protein
MFVISNHKNFIFIHKGLTTYKTETQLYKLYVCITHNCHAIYRFRHKLLLHDVRTFNGSVLSFLGQGQKYVLYPDGHLLFL